MAVDGISRKMTVRLADRVLSRIRKELLAVRMAFGFVRAADKSLLALGMFVVGLAHATPRGWFRQVLARLGVRHVCVQPRRLLGFRLLVDPTDSGHTCVLDEFFLPPVAYDFDLLRFCPTAVIDCGAHIGTFALV